MKPSAEAFLILALLALLFFLSMRSRLSQREEIVRATPLGKRPQRRPRPCTAEPEAPQTPLGPVRVACVGDSLTRGDRDANGSKPLRKWALVGNYPIRLQERLGRQFSVFNFGHGGAALMTLSGFHYGETSEHAAALDYNPNLVVLMLGTNDARLPVWRNPDLASKRPAAAAQLAADAEAIVLRFLALSNAPALLMVTPPPLLEPGNEENRKRFVLPALREGYARARRAAHDNGTADGGWLCVPRALSLISLDGVIPADEEIFLPDRVHLNFKGTKKLADYVADHLSKCKAARNALARKRRRRPACAREVLYDNAEML